MKKYRIKNRQDHYVVQERVLLLFWYSHRSIEKYILPIERIIRFDKITDARNYIFAIKDEKDRIKDEKDKYNKSIKHPYIEEI